jgi:hypothetical protein
MGWRGVGFALATGTSIAFLACGSRIESGLVKRWAANDFNCDESLIVIDDIADNGAYHVRGCERSAHYLCERRSADTIRCVPERSMASGSTPSDLVLPPASGCNCGSFGSHDPPAAQSPSTPVMPQKPYR